MKILIVSRQSILNRLPFYFTKKGSETMAKLDELKQKLTAKQIQAAYLLVENELMESNNEEKEPKTKWRMNSALIGQRFGSGELRIKTLLHSRAKWLTVSLQRSESRSIAS